MEQPGPNDSQPRPSEEGANLGETRELTPEELERVRQIRAEDPEETKRLTDEEIRDIMDKREIPAVLSDFTPPPSLPPRPLPPTVEPDDGDTEPDAQTEAELTLRGGDLESLAAKEPARCEASLPLHPDPQAPQKETGAQGEAESEEENEEEASDGDMTAEVEDEPGTEESERPPKPQWRVLEPEDQTDPRPHQATLFSRTEAGFIAIGGSVRGRLHEHRGEWREDSFGFAQIPGWTISVVSDGAGSAALSRVGSQMAVDGFVKALKPLLTGFKVQANNGGAQQNDLLRLRAFLDTAAKAALLDVIHESKKRELQPRDFSATMLACVTTPLEDGAMLLAGIQIGDGAIGVHADDGETTVLALADHGDFSSETRFLTTPHISLEFPQRCFFSVKHGVRALAIMSDGISDDFFPERARLGELFNGDPVEELETPEEQPLRGVLHILQGDEEKDQEALLEWMRYQKRGSSDDRTLLLLVRAEETT